LDRVDTPTFSTESSTSGRLGRALICRFRGQHILRRQRTPDTLERKLSHRFDRYGILDCHKYARTNQDLPWLRLIAKARRNIGYSANGGIVETPLETDGAKGGKSGFLPPQVPKRRFRELDRRRAVPDVGLVSRPLRSSPAIHLTD
jgi:hypothetical protein